jgi:hypothetical protein
MDKTYGQGSLIDWAVCYALSGEEYFNEIATTINFTVLHAALLLTISMPNFISPPDFEYERLGHYYMFTMGLSAMTHLTCILCSTIYISNLTRPYRGSDSMLMRMDDNIMFIAIVCDYLGVISLAIGMVMAGCNSSYSDGYVHMYYLAAISLMIVLFWAYSGHVILEMQADNCVAFRNQYLDEDGQLKDEYLYKIYGPKDLKHLIEANLATLTRGNVEMYLTLFTKHSIATLDHVKYLTDAHLVEMGIENMSDRITFLHAFAEIP